MPGKKKRKKGLTIDHSKCPRCGLKLKKLSGFWRCEGCHYTHNLFDNRSTLDWNGTGSRQSRPTQKDESFNAEREYAKDPTGRGGLKLRDE